MSVPLILTSTIPIGDPSPPGAPGVDAPRVDFLEIARALGGRLSYPSPGGLLARFEEKTASDWRQAWAARRVDASLYLSMSERVGLPLALLNGKRTPHVLLAHILTSARKRALQRRIGYLRRFDRVVVNCRPQEAYLREEACLPAERIRMVYHNVDHVFFAPQGGVAKGYVLAVGQEQRDYKTLMEAVRPLGLPTIIVASSAWLKEEGLQEDIPANVTLKRGLTYTALRTLYDEASLVVVPLQAGLKFASGATAVLEAMAMRKPLVVTATPGIADYVRDGETAWVVPPADAAALGAAISGLFYNETEAERLAAQARRIIEEGRNLDAYVRAIAAITSEVLTR